MTRIIGGIAGSIKLASPAKVTRPTSDRIREAIFNRLEARTELDEITVLDLYAGTGALGLEAVSRGAAKCILVEKDSKAAVICIKNAQQVLAALEKAKLDPDVQVANKSVASFLASTNQSFDLVFIDPPYEVENQEITENLTQLIPHLAEFATVMVERSSRSGDFQIPAGLSLDSQKTYGDTEIFWLSAD